VSSSAGEYTIPLLRVGTYELTAEQTGFKRYTRPGIVVEVGQTVSLDIRMEVGVPTQTVEVKGQAPLLQKDTSDRGTVVSSRDVEELPIVSQSEQRNPGFYMTLAPGVSGRGTATPTASGSGRQLNTTVNGSPSGSTEFHLDGAVIGQGYMLAGDFRNLPFPPDAVGEFNVMTLNPPAQYGQTGLGITSFSIKSGTNQLHGSVYEYLRNEALDANTFFANAAPPGCDANGHAATGAAAVKACRTLNKQNEFGATVGGPVVIPKLYNGKDKTFFFGWYHGYRLSQQGGSAAKDTLPTAAMKNGDLSNVLGPQIATDALGRPVYGSEIYDPATTRTVGAGAVDPVTGLVNKSGSSAMLRDAFGATAANGWKPSNIIPTDRIDPVAAKMYSYFADPPPCPTCAYGYQLNWLGTYPVRATINQWGSKIDHAITDHQRIMGEFIWWHDYAPGGSKWPGAISEGAIAYTQQDIARFSHDWIIRPNLVNHWTIAYNRNRSDTFPTAGTGWPAKLGYSGVPQTGPGSTFVEMDIGGLGNTYARSGQNYGATNDYVVDENLSWIKGRHTIKTGFNYIKLQQNAFGSTYQSSYLTFSAGTTALPLPGTLYNDGCAPGGQCTGMGAAGFLLGQVDHGLAGVTGPVVGDRMGRYAGWVQDDFKATSKLTLNLGLRYDLILPTVSAHNEISWMDPLVVNPDIGIKGSQVFATPSRRAAAYAYTKAFGPRIGLAYALNDKTVIRSGYGILYTAGGAERSIANSFEQLGFSASNSVVADSSTGYPGLFPGTVPGHTDYHFTLQNGWPATLFKAPPFISPSATLGQGPPSFGAYPGDGKLPSIQNWNFSIQRQLPGQVLLDVAYVGTKGTHLPSRLMNSNVMPTKYMYSFGPMTFTQPDGTQASALVSKIGLPAVQALPIVQGMPVDPATGNHSPFKGFEALWGGSATLGQALRPYPQFTTDTVEGLSQLRDFGEGVGNSSYNAFQIQARKHFSEGLSFLVSYTWSKTLTDAESLFNEFSGFTQDFYNAKAEKALSINDYPQNLVISYEYQLPFGPGKKFANTGGAVGKVIGGWSIAGVQQYQSGPPSIITSGGAAAGYPYVGPNGFIARPNVVPGVPKKSAAILNGTWDPNGVPVHNDGTACTKANPCTFANAHDPGAVLNGLGWSNPAPWTLGDAPRTDGGARRFAYLNEDISLIKRTNITERVNVEFRADFLNLFNRTVFGFDQGGDQYGSIIGGNSIGSGIGAFGHVTAQSNFPREIQFGLKINY
jgi:hypothetical protein